MDLFDRILELSRYGYFCSQILAILMLETVGEENPGLVKAMGGLNGGVGFSGGCCGCMTGGACLISYFTGKGEDTGMDAPEHKSALGEFTKWFDEEMLIQYAAPNAVTSPGETRRSGLSYAPRLSRRPMRNAWKYSAKRA